MIWLPPSPVSKLDRRRTGKLKMKDNLLAGEGVGGGGGAKSYNHKKVWSSLNHSILSATYCLGLGCAWSCQQSSPHTQNVLHCNESPRKGIVRPQSKFPHSCVCERFIYSQDRSAYFSCSRIGRPIMGIYKSLTDT
jgi:hypothetical protein